MPRFLIICLLIIFITTNTFADITTKNAEIDNLGAKIGAICWLTIINNDAKRSWTIDNSDFSTTADATAGYGGGFDNLNAAIDNQPNVMGYHKGEHGNPLSYAVFATDAVVGKGEQQNLDSGLRLAVDSNNRTGYSIYMKANGDALESLTTSENVPIEQVSWWTSPGEFADPPSTPVGSYYTAGYNSSEQLTTVDQVIFSTTDEGANVTTLNMALTLFSLDAFDDNYQQVITLTLLHNQP